MIRCRRWSTRTSNSTSRSLTMKNLPSFSAIGFLSAISRERRAKRTETEKRRFKHNRLSGLQKLQAYEWNAGWGRTLAAGHRHSVRSFPLVIEIAAKSGDTALNQARTFCRKL